MLRVDIVIEFFVVLYLVMFVVIALELEVFIGVKLFLVRFYI